MCAGLMWREKLVNIHDRLQTMGEEEREKEGKEKERRRERRRRERGDGVVMRVVGRKRCGGEDMRACD